MRKFKSIRVGLYQSMAALSLISMMAQETSAALVAVDLLEISGTDTFLTRDTGTGLDWLDVNLTTQISYDFLLAGSTIANGGALDSLNPITGAIFSPNPFRHANSAELLTLFANANISNINLPAANYFAANYNPVESLMDLVSTTFVAGSGPLTYGFQADASTGIPGYQNLGRLRNCNSLLPLCTGGNGLTFQSGQAIATFTAALPSLASGTVGHWLVRDSSATTMIPEPSTWALMLTGLAVVGFARRKRVFDHNYANRQLQ